jgi:hypothetical protein
MLSRRFNAIIIRNNEREERERKLSLEVWLKILLNVLIIKQKQQDLKQQALKISTRKLYRN